MIAELCGCEYYKILAPPLAPCHLPSPLILDLVRIPGHLAVLLYHLCAVCCSYSFLSVYTAASIVE
jgi:hypothetical protein